MAKVDKDHPPPAVWIGGKPAQHCVGEIYIETHAVGDDEGGYGDNAVFLKLDIREHHASCVGIASTDGSLEMPTPFVTVEDQKEIRKLMRQAAHTMMQLPSIAEAIKDATKALSQ
jgi:hypothetical protein